MVFKSGNSSKGLPAGFNTEKSEYCLLFSIRPEYSQLILEGKKTIELRKRLPKRECKFCVIYESSPTKGIVGIFEIKSIEAKPVSEISRLEMEEASVPKAFFKEYYHGHGTGVLVKIAGSRSLPMIGLKSLKRNHDFNPPQDFMYMPKERFLSMLNHKTPQF